MNPCILVYSKATGRRRRGYYQVEPVASAIQFLNECPVHPGEARMIYMPTGNEGPGLHAAQQAAINAVTGKSVVHGVPSGDRYAEVDGQNNIISIHTCDPSCGDIGPNGGTLVLAPDNVSMNWTYDGTTFTPPVFVSPKATTL